MSERAEFPFGTLWESEDEQGARTLVLRFSNEVEDPAAKVREAMAEAERIDHVQVVPWADGGVTDGVGWLAAPMFGPWSLQDHVLRNEGLAPLDAAPILHQIARTLAVTEGSSLVHHCLASELVRLVPIPEGGYAVKLYGYGVHNILPPYKPLRKNAAFVGVPDYMAPELCAGKPADGLADVYAVGILMYEAIRGRPPFAPTFASASASTTLKRQIFEKPLALHVRYTSVPHVKAYENIALKALSKTANRRQASMAALEEELAQLVTGEMRSGLVSVASAASRPATTSRRMRTQVLPPLAGGGGAEAELQPHEAYEGTADHLELNDELAAAAEAEETHPEPEPEVAPAVAPEPEPEPEPAHAAATADDEDEDEDEAPEPKKRGDATLVFAGLGPKVRELAREKGLPDDDDWDEDDVDADVEAEASSAAADDAAHAAAVEPEPKAAEP
ncbi:MAG: protein kinase, partial [Myxococcales bacterium]|nr:protein kinase [Myxococcales bacterium]